MGTLLKWFYMLSKRLYKKPSFLVLLVLIPLCVALFAGAAGRDSGFIHIVLAREQEDDPIAAEVMDTLLSESGMMRFTRAVSGEAALDAVRTGQADEAWIFPDHTQTQIENFLSGRQKYIVRAVTREQNMTAQLAREKLSAALYEACAKAYYLDYIRANISQLDGVSDGELIACFENVQVDEDLFVYGNPADTHAAQPTNYLTSPIRGLLAVVMLLCGMAATLYYLQDEASGTFAWVRQSRKALTALGCVLTATANISVAVLLSLVFSSLAGNVLREIGALVLYSLCCGAFCLVLKALLPGIRGFAATVPLVTVVLLGICPVFYDFRRLPFLQLLFPPTYYINAAFDSKYLLYMLAYIPLCLGLCGLLQLLKRFFANSRHGKKNVL